MRFVALIFGLLCFAWAVPSSAKQSDFDMSAFETLPVLHDGRVKPIKTFASAHLELFSGQTSLNRASASQWLANTLFNPADAVNDRIFLIRNPALISMLGVRKNEDMRYRYQDISPVLKNKKALIESLLATEDVDLTQVQKDLLELHKNTILYAQLLRSLSLFLPLNLNVPDRFLPAEKSDAGNGYQTYYDLRSHEQKIQQEIQGIIQKKRSDPARYNDDEKAVTLLGYQLQLVSAAGQNTVLLRLLPPQWADAEQIWLSPWALLQSGSGSPQSAIYMRHWSDMARAYHDGNTVLWSHASQQALTQIAVMMEGDSDLLRLNLETLYGGWPFYHSAIFLYGVALFLMVAFYRFRQSVWYRASIIFCSAGVLIHMTALCLRVFILERPPVGTLYESVLFVALVCALGTLLLEWRQKNGLGVMIASVSGAGLLFIANGFSQGGDSMSMLVAVLNTNFWLATHVICITAGYGACIVTALLGHGYLAVRWLRPGDTKAVLQMLDRNTHFAAIVALMLTTVGTILGGIWADQSWGRFWGWDPKENGALLIVLWLVWILHGRLSGHIEKAAFAAGMAFLNIIVALAWFGVNLLNTGLHSYGFISGVAGGLFVFCSLQTLIIVVLYMAAKRTQKVMP